MRHAGTDSRNGQGALSALLPCSCSVFSYFDNRDTRHIILEVEANGILEADEVLKIETGIIAAKTPGIGCAPGRAFTFEPMTEEKAAWIGNGGYDYFSQNDLAEASPDK